MDRWLGKVAIVTGASSGIGAAIAIELVKQGLKVVGVARRLDRLEKLKSELSNERGEFHPIKCDLMIESDILNVFKWTKKNLGGVDILVNNAGVANSTSLMDGDTEKWKSVLDTNILAVCIATREAVRLMKERSVFGHIIHINSIAGHVIIPQFAAKMNVYFASKHALRALAETLRCELENTNENIRITDISPGYVKTEILGAGDMDSSVGELLVDQPALIPKDLADAVIYALGTPENVNVSEIILHPRHVKSSQIEGSCQK